MRKPEFINKNKNNRIWKNNNRVLGGEVGGGDFQDLIV